MRSRCGPCGRRAINCGRRHCNVLRGIEALNNAVAREVCTVVVGGILLFIRSEVTKVGLHRGDVRLVLRVRKLRNRDRGKNADDDDHDQKLNECKTLFVAHLFSPGAVEGAKGFGTLYQKDSTLAGHATAVSARLLPNSGSGLTSYRRSS